MTKRLFDGSIDFRGLEEAIEYILNEEGDPDVSYDLVAIPLDPSIITDKEEGVKMMSYKMQFREIERPGRVRCVK
ncbi:unnamed protein product, partial [Brenthis ino]